MIKDRSVKTKLFRVEDPLDCLLVGTLLTVGLPLAIAGGLLWGLGWLALRIRDEVTNGN